MNPYSGEIKNFPRGGTKAIPKGWILLTTEEAREYLTLPPDLRIQHWMKAHGKEKCQSCGCFIWNHSLRKFKECAANELASFDI